MAIETDLGAEHLVADEFNELISTHGTPALWRTANTCPCLDAQTGQPALNCPYCRDLPGWIWQPGTDISVLAFSRERKDDYGEAGMAINGMLTMSFTTDTVPGHRDLIQLSAAAMVVNNERHVRGETRGGFSTERLRIRPSLGVESCLAIVDGELMSYVENVDFTINDAGDVEWSGGPPATTSYTLRYETRPTYIVLSPYSRDEAGTPMPYRALCQRLDFFQVPIVGEG